MVLFFIYCEPLLTCCKIHTYIYIYDTETLLAYFSKVSY